MKKELLAPAGDIEAGYAALYYGADAVYLGLKQFSARATATNFDEKNLGEFTAYAHFLNRKVYVALNTLIRESELDDLMANLDMCVRCGIDALIIQDLGVARIVKAKYPELELHASTQMAVHNKEGALALQKAGFSRVVVARELTLNEIKEIAAIPNLEIEAFIHGALCYSYSGLCLFSALETGRSANRGKCLYPCRAEFEGEDGKQHYFSMKDMALEQDVLKMPVLSLKIEGRKKTALYVAAVVDYYRGILDGKGVDNQKADNIKQIFARPWCKFHFNGRNKEVIDRNFVGHRGLITGKIEQVYKGKMVFKTQYGIARHDGLQIDVEGQEKPFGFSLQSMRVNGRNVFEAKSGEVVEVMLPPKSPALKKGQVIYLASSSRVKGAYAYSKPKSGEFKPRVKVDVRVKIEPDKVFAQACEAQVVLGGDFVNAENSEKVIKSIHQAFEKCGDTNFILGELIIENPQNLFVPISILNELRRQLYSEIVIEHKRRELPEVKVKERENVKWIVRTDNAEVIKALDFDKLAEVIFMISADVVGDEWKNVPKNKLRLALPAVCRNMSKMKKTIERLLAQGYRKWEIANYWGLSVLPENGIDLSFDTSLYMFNSQAVAMAKEFGASRVCLALEDNLQNWQDICAKAAVSVVLPVYQDVPMFTSVACIRSNACKICPREEKWMHLTRDGKKYDVLSKNCQTMLFRNAPLCFDKEYKNVNADYYRIDFVYKKYAPDEVRRILNNYM